MAANERGFLSGHTVDSLRLLFKRSDAWVLKALAAVLVVGLILLAWPKTTPQAVPPRATLVDAQPSPDDRSRGPESEDVEAVMEHQIESLLSEVAGAGTVSVDIRLEVKDEARYSTNSRVEKRSTQEKGQDGVVRSTTEETRSEELVMEKDARGQEIPVLAGRPAPVISGVVVVADGAFDDSVRLALARATASLLDIPLYRVVVLTREGGK